MTQATNTFQGGLELRLFEDLDEAQKREAALILATLVISDEEFSSSDFKTLTVARIEPNSVEDEILNARLSYLRDNAESDVVVTGVDGRNVVSVYEMAAFERNGDSLENMYAGRLIAHPPGRRFGSMTIEAATQILGAVANLAGSDSLTHYVHSKSSTLFTRFGYKPCSDDLWYHRHYEPQNRPLGPHEEGIVRDFLQKIQPYSTPQQNSPQILSKPIHQLKIVEFSF